MIGSRVGNSGKHGKHRKYVTVDVLGSGGMAQVFLACTDGDAATRAWVAIKQVRDQNANDPTFARLFEDEARLAARIDHRNVCRVLEFDTSSEQPVLVMEYLHGQPLSALLGRAWQESGPGFGVVARIVADASRGLHAAHELKTTSGALANVVHRDVSPPNVFVCYDGVSKVVDFGVARWSERRSEPTSDDVLRGRLRYMSPEQVQQAPLDRRSDVFSLGVVLWEATLGRRLFARDNAAATVRAIVEEPVPPPSSFDESIPAELEAIILRALAHRPADRYPTALALAEALDGWASTQRDADADAVAAAMHRWFAAERRAREELMQAPVWHAPPDTSAMVATVHERSKKSASPRLAAAATLIIVAAGATGWLAHARPVSVTAAGTIASSARAATVAHTRSDSAAIAAAPRVATATPLDGHATSARDAGLSRGSERPVSTTRSAGAARAGAARRLLRGYEHP